MWWVDGVQHQPVLLKGALIDISGTLYRSWELVDHDRSGVPGVFPCGGGASGAGALSFGQSGVRMVSMDNHVLEYSPNDGSWRALSWYAPMLSLYCSLPLLLLLTFDLHLCHLAVHHSLCAKVIQAARAASLALVSGATGRCGEKSPTWVVAASWRGSERPCVMTSTASLSAEETCYAIRTHRRSSCTPALVDSQASTTHPR